MANVANPRGRPRKDPNEARVHVSVRVSPKTWRMLRTETGKGVENGDSIGLLLDRLVADALDWEAGSDHACRAVTAADDPPANATHLLEWTNDHGEPRHLFSYGYQVKFLCGIHHLPLPPVPTAGQLRPTPPEPEPRLASIIKSAHITHSGLGADGWKVLQIQINASLEGLNPATQGEIGAGIIAHLRLPPGKWGTYRDNLMVYRYDPTLGHDLHHSPCPYCYESLDTRELRNTGGIPPTDSAINHACKGLLEAATDPVQPPRLPLPSGWTWNWSQGTGTGTGNGMWTKLPPGNHPPDNP